MHMHQRYLRSRAAGCVGGALAAWLLIAWMPAAGSAQESMKYLADDASRQGQLGFSVSFDGTTLFSGAPGLGQRGRGFLFDLETGVPRELQPTGQRNDGLFGFTSQLDGDWLIIGDPGNPFISSPPNGAVYVFDPVTGQQRSRFEAPNAFGGDEFGFGVNLHGPLAAIGAPNLGVGEGAAYVWDLAAETQLHRLVPADPLAGSEFGADVALNADYVLVGAPANYDTLGFFPGALYVFDTQTGDQLFKLQPQDSTPGDEFGFDMAISGDLAVVGAPFGGSGEGVAYVFDLSTGQQLHKLTPSDSEAGNDFGATVAIDGGLVAVGASGLQELPGAVYLFDALTGMELQKLAPSDLQTGDAFGVSVALRGNQLLVGSPRDDDVTLNAGSAYRFDLDGVLPGDFDRSGVLDVADIDLLTTAVARGGDVLRFDLNSDGQLTEADRTVWVEVLFGTYFGDANLDGEFGTADLVTTFQRGQYEDQVAGNSSWATGDFNGDFDFTTSDLVRAFQGGGYEQGQRGAAQAVPEPATWWLSLLGLLLLRGYGRIT